MGPRLYESSLVQNPDALFHAADIKFVPGTVQAIHCNTQTIDVKPTSSTALSITYERVILAAGSSVIRPESITGLRQQAFDIDTLASAIKLEVHLEGLASRQASLFRETVVVCGAGFTSIELAAELPKCLPSPICISTRICGLPPRNSSWPRATPQVPSPTARVTTRSCHASMRRSSAGCPAIMPLRSCWVNRLWNSRSPRIITVCAWDWGAVVAGGWDEKKVKVSGDLAKRV